MFAAFSVRPSFSRLPDNLLRTVFAVAALFGSLALALPADASVLRLNFSSGPLTLQDPTAPEAAGLPETMPGLDFWIEFDVGGPLEETSFEYLEYWFGRDRSLVGENYSPYAAGFSGWQDWNFPTSSNIDPAYYQGFEASYFLLNFHGPDNFNYDLFLVDTLQKDYSQAYSSASSSTPVRLYIQQGLGDTRVTYTSSGPATVTVAAPIPLPASLLLALAGLAALPAGAALSRRRRPAAA